MTDPVVFAYVVFILPIVALIGIRGIVKGNDDAE